MKKKIKISKFWFVVALISLSVLQGCVLDGDRSLDRLKVGVEQTPPSIAPRIKEETFLAELVQPRDAVPKKKKKKRPLTNYVSEVWLGDRARRLSRGQTSLPRRLTRYHDLTFITPSMGLPRIADRLSGMIETPIQIEGSDGKVSLIGKKGLRFKGKVSALLDMLATNFDAVWRYDRTKHRIIFQRVLTREASFYVGAGAERFIKKISTTSDEAASFSSGREILLDPWQELKGDLEKFLPTGSQVSFSPSTGKVVITTRPTAMARALELIEKRSRTLQRQIYFNIQLIELIITKKRLAGVQGAISLATLLSQASEGTLRIRKKKVIIASSRKGIVAKGRKKVIGTSSLSVVLDALGMIGNVSVLASNNSWTRNGKAFPVRTTSQRAYVSQVKGSELVQAQLETSFYLNLLPLILPEDRVQVDLSVSLKTLQEMRQYDSGGTRVQLPQTSTKTWTQEAIIPNDVTLLLSGFEIRRASNGNHRIMILLITPQVMEEK